MTYSDRLSLAMQRAQASKTGLAKEIGVSFQAVQAVLAGKSKALTAENNAKAAAALGVNSDWLASGKGEMASGLSDEDRLTDGERLIVKALRLLPAAACREVEELIHSRAQEALAQLQALAKPEVVPANCPVGQSTRGRRSGA